MKFIEGKWYKYSGWYIKYLRTDGNKAGYMYFIASETINVDKKYNKTEGSFGYADNEKVLLTDLTEIQQYLPNNHPDKIIQYEIY